MEGIPPDITAHYHPWVLSILTPTLSRQLNIFHPMEPHHLASESWSCLVARLSVYASWCCLMCPSLQEKGAVSSVGAVITPPVSLCLPDLQIPILPKLCDFSSSEVSIPTLSGTSGLVLCAGTVSAAVPPLFLQAAPSPSPLPISIGASSLLTTSSAFAALLLVTRHSIAPRLSYLLDPLPQSPPSNSTPLNIAVGVSPSPLCGAIMTLPMVTLNSRIFLPSFYPLEPPAPPRPPLGFSSQPPCSPCAITAARDVRALIPPACMYP